MWCRIEPGQNGTELLACFPAQRGTFLGCLAPGLCGFVVVVDAQLLDLRGQAVEGGPVAGGSAERFFTRFGVMCWGR